MRLVGLLSMMLAGGWPIATRSVVHAGHLAGDRPPATMVTGVVFDSLEMRVLPGATVQIADATGRSWSRTTDADSIGRFAFSDVPTGTYLLGFFHPKLDSLALAPPILRIDVRTDQPIQARLAIPSARTIVRALCGVKAATDSSGLLLGYVRGADNSMPRANATLGVRWAEIIIEKGAIHQEVPSVEASTSATGQFAVCGVPLATPIVLQAASASDSSGAFEVTIPPSGLLLRDVFVAPFTRTKVAVSDSAPPVEMLRGTARLRGQVVGSTGRPVAGARVMVWGTGAEATSDEDGKFTLGALPGGTHTLEVRAVGFSPVQRPVDIVQGTPGATEVELTTFGITLDTVRVVAKRLYTSRREAEFERRLRSGVGHVIDEAEIEKRRPMAITDLLRMVPGVMVVPGQRSSEDVLMRGGLGIMGGGYCRPDVLIDGVRVVNDETFPFNSMVSVSDLRAVEVYARASLVPAELSSLSGCGVIAIWTGPRRKSGGR